MDSKTIFKRFTCLDCCYHLPDSKLRRVANVNGKAESIGRCCRYPPTLLSCDPPHELADYLPTNNLIPCGELLIEVLGNPIESKNLRID